MCFIISMLFIFVEDAKNLGSTRNAFPTCLRMTCECLDGEHIFQNFVFSSRNQVCCDYPDVLL